MKVTERFVLCKVSLQEEVLKKDGNGTYSRVLFELPNEYSYMSFLRGNEPVAVRSCLRDYDLGNHGKAIGSKINELNQYEK